MNDALDAVLDRRSVPPVHNAIVRVDGPGLSWTAARGQVAVGDPTPARADHAFRTASVAKTITAATVVRLAEEGHLSLDDLVVDHVDADLVEQAHVLDGQSYGREITVRQTLNHTAGLYDFAKDDEFALLALEDPHRRWTPRELLATNASLQPPYFRPGAGCHYSDANYVLAGMVAESAGGEPLHEAERRLVLDPLGMDRTWMEDVEPTRHDVAHAHYDDNDVMDLDSSFEWAAGALVTTTEDLTRLVRGVTGDGLFRTLGSDVVDLVPFGPGHHEEMRAYGLGVMECELGGERLLGHTGFWGTFMFLWLRRDVTICGTVNQVGGFGVELVADLVETLDRGFE